MMGRRNFSLPVERRKAQLKSQELGLKVKIAESREKLAQVKQEQSALRPPKKQE